ncbi:hypothetical protein GCM10027073_31290 [Streptomyces chlorus]
MPRGGGHDGRVRAECDSAGILVAAPHMAAPHMAAAHMGAPHPDHAPAGNPN